jgi:serine/threonine protein kinase
MEFQPGQVVGGRYEVISRLGKGGMGLVYRVKQVLLNKEFALKTIDKNCMTEIAIRRFQQEARTTFSLDHPNIITVNDFGLLDDQTPFLVMELLNGETLGERLKRVGVLTVEEAIPIFVQVCFGIAYAHECGIVHRDIKPNNIMLLKGLPAGAEGSVKILDFGVAKLAGNEAGEIQALTRTGEIFGSPLYMSPEQCAGFKVDHRADIYSLGCVLFESLTGTAPFVGDTALSTMMKHQTEATPSLREASLGGRFPKGIEDIVAKMLVKAPDQRYQTVGMVAQDLGALKRGESISHLTQTQMVSMAQAKKTISMTRSSYYGRMFVVAVVAAALGYGAASMLRPLKNANLVQQPIAKPIKNEAGLKQEIDYFGSKLGSIPLEQIPKAMGNQRLQDISVAELQENLAQQPAADGRFQLRNRRLSADALRIIGNATWIRDLDLKGCTFDNKGFDGVAAINMWAIDVGDTNFDNVGAERLSACKSLTNIYAKNSLLGSDGLDKLANIRGLSMLEIGGTKVTDSGLAGIAKARDLKNLNMESVPITDNGLKGLEGCSHLLFIDLNSTPIGDAGMGHLAKLAQLASVSLSETKVTVKGLKELCKSKTVKIVTIRECQNLTEADILSLRKMFHEVRFDFAPQPILSQ